MRNTTEFKIDAMLLSKEVKLPLVVREKVIDGRISYVGFVPGLLMMDIVGYDLETVKKDLETVAKKIVVNMLENNEPFPFFPTKEEILKDFENVVYLKLVKLK